MLFRNIALISSLEKLCYLKNRVVREPCKRRSACSCQQSIFSAPESIPIHINFQSDESGKRVSKTYSHTLYLMSVTKLNVLLVMSLIEETLFNMQSLFC